MSMPARRTRKQLHCDIDRLDQVKNTLSLKSDYQLAKKMEIADARISEYRTGKRNIPLDKVFWIAITLKLDPATVVADLELSRETNDAKREFWQSFLLRARSRAAATLCTLALTCFVICAGAMGAVGGSAGIFGRRRHFV